MMPKVFSFFIWLGKKLFPFLDDKVPKWKKVTSTIMMIYVIFFIFFPQLIFSYKTKYGRFTVYTRTPFPKEAYAVLDSAELHLQKGIIDQKKVTYTLLICDHYWLYALFSPGSYQSFGITRPLFNHIFISKTDWNKNQVYRNGEEYAHASLSRCIAHECTHVLLFDTLGLLKGLSIDKWKSEGFCDYSAGSSSFPYQQGIQLVCQEKEDPSGSFFYFKSRMRTKALFEDKKLTFKQFVDVKYPEDSLKTWTKTFICAK